MMENSKNRKLYLKEYYIKNLDRIKRSFLKRKKLNPNLIKEINRKYYESHKEKIKSYKLIYNKLHRKERQEAVKRCNEKFPNKRKARTRIMNALARKEIIRPNHCQKCFKTCKPSAHHWNGYSKENWLNVQWVCLECHIHLHKKI